MLQLKNLKLSLAALLGMTIVNYPYSAVANRVNSEVKSEITQNSLRGNRTDSHQISPINQKSVIGKKSGGRSGGGSFKSKPSRSKTSSPRRKSSSPNSNSRQRKYNSPSYKKTYPRERRNSSPTYQHHSNTHSRRRSRGRGGFISILFWLIFLGGLIFILFYIFNQIWGTDRSSNRKESKIIRERDNDIVTVSLLQVVLSSNAVEIQQDLSELSTTVDTSTDAGLAELMQESSLLLLRQEENWTHVFNNSHSLDISQAEQAFDRLSFNERKKFSNESLSNVGGNLKTKAARRNDNDAPGYYIVVTLILGTADDRPLFEKVNTAESLQAALLKLSSMREDYLMKLELLWTPQQTGEYLTDEELLLEYTNAILL